MPFKILLSRDGLLEKVLASGASDLNTALLGTSPCRRFTECYAPGFELVNPNARVALIGYTPGRSQGDKAWCALNQTQNSWHSLKRLEICHQASSFSGLRGRIDQIAEHSGLLKHLAIESLSDTSDVIMTSRWVFPIFENGCNYTISPKAYQPESWLIKRCSQHLKDIFETCPSIKVAVFLGDGISAIKALKMHQKLGDIPSCIEVYTLPHPSGANNGRISEFLSQPRHLNSIRC